MTNRFFAGKPLLPAVLLSAMAAASAVHAQGPSAGSTQPPPAVVQPAQAAPAPTPAGDPASARSQAAVGTPPATPIAPTPANGALPGKATAPEPAGTQPVNPPAPANGVAAATAIAAPPANTTAPTPANGAASTAAQPADTPPATSAAPAGDTTSSQATGAPPAGSTANGAAPADGASAPPGDTAAPPAATGTTAGSPTDAAAPAATSSAENAAPAASETAANRLLPQDLTIAAMFFHADGVVRTVMLGLIAASILTWTILLAKGIDVALAKARLRRSLPLADANETLAELHLKLGSRNEPLAAMVTAALEEVRRSGDAPRSGIKERVASHLRRIEIAFGRRLIRSTGMLATIGSTAPFIGLFGTVWGIMDSFIGISQAQTTNLAVVAPGIAEALLATAAGLVAAIPAVVIYNGFARSIGGYRAMLADLAAAVERLVSRELDSGRRSSKAAAE